MVDGNEFGAEGNHRPAKVWRAVLTFQCSSLKVIQSAKSGSQVFTPGLLPGYSLWKQVCDHHISW